MQFVKYSMSEYRAEDDTYYLDVDPISDRKDHEFYKVVLNFRESTFTIERYKRNHYRDFPHHRADMFYVFDVNVAPKILQCVMESFVGRAEEVSVFDPSIYEETVRIPIA